MRFTLIIKDSLFEEIQRLRGERIAKEAQSIPMTEIITELIENGLESTKKKGAEKN